MRLPAHERRLERLGKVRPHVEPAVAGAAAQPFDAAADRKVDAELGDVEWNDADRLVRVEEHVCAVLVRVPDDCGDVLDLRRLEQHVRDRDEQRAFVDRVDDRSIVRNDDDIELYTDDSRTGLRERDALCIPAESLELLGIAEVQSIVVNDLGLLLQPVLPALLADRGENPGAQFVGKGRRGESFAGLPATGASDIGHGRNVSAKRTA